MNALVPIAELEAILPRGFDAVEASPGSATAAITLDFIFQQRMELIGIGTFGPASGLQVQATALNTELSRQERLILAWEFSDAVFVKALDAAFGSGSSRPAKTKVDIKEDEATLQFKFHVVDEPLGLNVKLTAEGPAGLVERFHADPQPSTFRSLNDGEFTNPPFRLALQQDRAVVPTTAESLALDVPGGRLRLPGGSLTIVGVAPTFNVVRLHELFSKPE